MKEMEEEVYELKDRVQDHIDDDKTMEKMAHKYGLTKQGDYMNQDLAGLMALAKDGDNGMNDMWAMILGLVALKEIGGIGTNGNTSFAQQSDIFASTQAITNNLNDVNLGITQTVTNQAQNTNGIINAGFTAMGNRQDQIQNSIRTVGDVLGSGQVSLGNKVEAANYANLIQFKDLDNKLCGMESRLAAQATANQYETNNNFKEMEIRGLEQSLNEAQRERDLYMTGNFPVTTPGHLDRWNGHSGVDIDQNAINIAVGNGIAQGIAQLAPVLATK